jgi:2-hydroxychromene-2-carboxylate isomerase
MTPTDAQSPARPGTGLRVGLAPLAASVLTSTWLRDLRRRGSESRRRRSGRPHEVHYFHQVDDPYSALTAQALPSLARRYDVQVIPHIVPPPEDWAAPDRARLDAYGLRDAIAVAPAYDIRFKPASRPSPARTKRAQAILCSAQAQGNFIEAADPVSDALWSDRSLNDLAARFGEAGRATVDVAVRSGSRARSEAGHYLGATFLYGGEWYWSVDRLDHLETRLADLGADRSPDAGPLWTRPPLQFSATDGLPADMPPLELFLSLRSPYSWLAIDRARAVADHYGLRLVLKPLLPMVMRGLPVPRAKRLYIVRDCKREAERLGLPFGRICDPVGRPVERGLAVLAGARPSGRDAAFAASFLKGVFAEGIDAGSARGLQHLCDRAGIAWSEALDWMTDERWREEAEVNRRELLNLSLWGVPSLRFGAASVWGQDRLWLIERAILEASNSESGVPT